MIHCLSRWIYSSSVVVGDLNKGHVFSRDKKYFSNTKERKNLFNFAAIPLQQVSRVRIVVIRPFYVRKLSLCKPQWPAHSWLLFTILPHALKTVSLLKLKYFTCWSSVVLRSECLLDKVSALTLQFNWCSGVFFVSFQFNDALSCAMTLWNQRGGHHASSDRVAWLAAVESQKIGKQIYMPAG